MIRFYPLHMSMPAFLQTGARPIPLMAALLHFPGQLVIVDTGFSGEPDLLHELDRLGVSPVDVDLVVNTHVHPDHAGNNRLFTRARVVVSRVDYEFAKSYCHAIMEAADPVKVFRRHYPEVREARLAKEAWQAQWLARQYWHDDLLGRADQIRWIEDRPNLPDAVRLQPLPGHSPGHYGVRLDTRPSLLICGDALASRLFWKSKLRELTPVFNNEQHSASKRLVEECDGLIMGGHDIPFWCQDGRYCTETEILLDQPQRGDAT
ncbi:MAG TPA: MBL fold metallo-hydrolase [bacterium]|nr:MBL fold metallo-hydrolase [bacterium]